MTSAQYGFHSCLVVIPERDVKFQRAVTAGLQGWEFKRKKEGKQEINHAFDKEKKN